MLDSHGFIIMDRFSALQLAQDGAECVANETRYFLLTRYCDGSAE